MAGIIVVFCSQRSSHMSQRVEHINSLNQKIHSYDQMRKHIVNLGSK